MILALDIGGTSAKVAIFDDGAVVGVPAPRYTTQIPFAQDKVRHPMLQTLYEELLPWLDTLNFPAKVKGVTIAATGQIDVTSGRVAGTCGNLPSWPGTELAATFQELFNCPVATGNDANLMLLGEVRFGAARGYDNVLGITLGTGVGGGILCNGTLLEGFKGYAGELGHLSVFGSEGRLCTCGQHGCIEQYCATSALLRSAREKGLDVPDAKTFCTLKDNPQTPHQEVYQAVWDRWLSDLAHALTGLIHLLNPELILIGGGISAQGERLLTPLREHVTRQVMPEFKKGLRLEKAALENAAGLYGALANLMRHHPELFCSAK